MYPRGAVRHLIGGGHAVTAGRILPGKAPAHRSHIDAVAKRLFAYTYGREPAEQRLARRPREWFVRLLLSGPRCLSNEQHRRDHGVADYRWPGHARTAG